MTTIVTRSGKGSSLTWAEMDANFTNLKNSIDATDLGARTFTGGITVASGDVQLDNAAYVKGKVSTGQSTRLLGINAANTVYLGSIDQPAAGGINFNINGTTLGSVSSTGLWTFIGNVTTLGPSAANPGAGANLRYRDDTATTRWLTGVLGSVGDKDFVVRDLVNSATRLTINNATGLMTLANGLNLGQQDLKNYSEGTWTPSLQGSTGSAGAYAASVAIGAYARVGRLVFCSFFITLSNKGSWTGNALIAGLPFNSNASSGWVDSAVFNEVDGVTFSGALAGQLVPGASTISLMQIASGTNTTNMPFTGLTNTSSILGTIVYQA